MTDFQRRNIHWITDVLDEYYQGICKAQTEEKQRKCLVAYTAAKVMAELALSVLFESSTLPIKIIKNSNNKHYIGLYDIDSDEYVDCLAIYDKYKQKEHDKRQIHRFCPHCGEASINPRF